MRAATASPNDLLPRRGLDLDDQPAMHVSKRAAWSPVGDHPNHRSDAQEASPERTTQTLLPVSRRKSPIVDQHNRRHRSRSHARVAGMKAPPSGPTKNDGVVLFFDGIHVDQTEWWIQGLKDVTSSIFASSPGRPGKDIAGCHERWLLKRMSAQPPISQLPMWATQGTREEYNPLHSSIGNKYYGDPNEDYDPEKDEGVYPSDWPRKSNSLLSGRRGHLERLEGDAVDSDEANPHVDTLRATG